MLYLAPEGVHVERAQQHLLRAAVELEREDLGVERLGVKLL